MTQKRRRPPRPPSRGVTNPIEEEEELDLDEDDGPDDPFLPPPSKEEEERPRRQKDRSTPPQRPVNAPRRENRATKGGHIVLAWNNVDVTGRFGRDVELEVTNNGVPKLVNSIAIYNGKDRNDNPLTIWMRVVFWRDIAETVDYHFKKGDRVRIQGHLNQWPGQNGPVTEIVGDSIQSAPWERSPYVGRANG